MKRLNPIFFSFGLILFLSECWKQWCLTFQLHNGVYQWWYFPFQLCSIPMYLCLALPFIRNADRRQMVLSFLSDFGLVGGIFAFFDTSGMHYNFTPLTIHSFLWHILLIIIGITAGLCRENVLRWEDCRRSVLLYLNCCTIAAALNFLLHPFGSISLFYISPYHKKNQAVFSDISELVGDTAGILIYIAATILGAVIFHAVWRMIRKKPA